MYTATPKRRIAPAHARRDRCRSSRLVSRCLSGNSSNSELTTNPANRVRFGLIIICLVSAIIAAVSIYDVYWSFKNQEVLWEFEENPVGSWLIAKDGGDVALFMTVKMISTMFVVAAVPILYRFRAYWGMAVGVSLATFQSGLFVYLNT
jgi:hypothetical protein